MSWNKQVEDAVFGEEVSTSLEISKLRMKFFEWEASSSYRISRLQMQLYMSGREKASATANTLAM